MDTTEELSRFAQAGVSLLRQVAPLAQAVWAIEVVRLSPKASTASRAKASTEVPFKAQRTTLVEVVARLLGTASLVKVVGLVVAALQPEEAEVSSTVLRTPFRAVAAPVMEIQRTIDCISVQAAVRLPA